MASEMRTLVCKLTETEKVAYRSEVAELGIAHGEICEQLKAKLQEIKVAKQAQEEILDTLKFGQEEGPDKDDHGRSVLVEIDSERREALESENLDLATQLEELTEERKAIHNERKTTKDLLTERLKALKYGQEEREVKCEWRASFGTQQTRLYRTDTGECIDSRALSEDERQQAFEFELPAKPAPRAMSRCPVCTASVESTASVLDDHMVGQEHCLGSGLTTQQAHALGGRLAEYPTLPDIDTLTALREEVRSVAYGLGRSSIRTAEDVAAERDALAGDDLTSEDEEDILDWDAASVLPEYLQQIGVSGVDELKPSHLDALLSLAGVHTKDLIAYLLAQPENLKPTVKRALKGWDK